MSNKKLNMKSIKITLIDTYDAFIALQDLLSKNEFPFELGWSLEDILDVLSKPAKRFEKTRGEIIKKYGVPNPKNPDLYNIKDTEGYNTEIQKLVNTEISLEFEPITFESLKAIPDLKVKPANLTVLKKHFIIRHNNNEQKKKENNE